MSPIHAMMPPLIEVSELLQLQQQGGDGATDLCVFDCRKESADGSEPKLPFIPGSRLLDHHPHLKSPQTDGKPGLFIMPPREFSEWAGRRGLSQDSHVVAYDHAKGVSASRLWWSLRYYGHTRVQVLNGGMSRWIAAGQKTSVDPSTPIATKFDALSTSRMVANHDDVAAARSQGALVIDVRTPGEWKGQDLRGNPRGGHIPGAIHIPFDELMDDQAQWKSAEAIKTILNGAGVPKAAPLITHCQAGIRASHFALSAVRAGWHDIRVYDGSFKDYSRRPDLPLIRK